MENNTRTGTEDTQRLEVLREEALRLLMQLTDEEKRCVLSPFAEKYGWKL